MGGVRAQSCGDLRVADDSRGGVLSLVSYDIDRTWRRAVVSVSDGRDGFIHMLDRSMDPPSSAAALATLHEPNRQPALAGTAPVVAYADNPSRQILVWNWQTGAVTPGQRALTGLCCGLSLAGGVDCQLLTVGESKCAG